MSSAIDTALSSSRWGVFRCATSTALPTNASSISFPYSTFYLLSSEHPPPPGPLCALLSAWGIGTRLSTEEAGPEAFRAFGLQCPPQLLRPIAFGVGPDPLLLNPLALALQ